MPSFQKMQISRYLLKLMMVQINGYILLICIIFSVSVHTYWMFKGSIKLSLQLFWWNSTYQAKFSGEYDFIHVRQIVNISAQIKLTLLKEREWCFVISFAILYYLSFEDKASRYLGIHKVSHPNMFLWTWELILTLSISLSLMVDAGVTQIQLVVYL